MRGGLVMMGITLPAIRPEFLFYGIAAGLLAAWMFAQKDRNGDGKADGLVSGIGYDAGRIVPDLVGGAASGLFDGTAALIGASDSDCARAKAAGNTAGIYWACWPTEWPVFNGK
jgi:hypothetical protein